MSIFSTFQKTLEESSFRSTILASERIGSHIQKVVLDIPVEQASRFCVGSYIQPMIQEKIPRAYSVCEVSSNTCTIIVSFSGQGVGARYFQSAPVGDRITVFGPYDDFPYHYGTDRSKVFLATGTGVAPFVRMVPEAMDEGVAILLILGVPTEEDIPYREYFEEQANQYSKFFFWPTLSSPNPLWEGARGYVTQHFIGNESWLLQSDIYVCGVPPMIEGTRKALKKIGVPRSQIFVQKFG